MKTLSVIIPLYNCEMFIVQAIGSLLCQEGVEMEIIVVNDGSTDNSIKKLSEFGSRLKVVSITNSGASAARNTGVRYVTGDYVMFLDADDYLDSCTVCSEAIKKIESTSSQMCLFRYKYLNNESGQIFHLPSFPHDLLNTTDSIVLTHGLIRSGIIPMSPVCKIIKRDILLNNNMFFLEGYTAEDIEWYSRLMLKIDKYCILNNDSYVYRKNLISSVTGSGSRKKCDNHYTMIDVSTKRIKNSTANSVLKESLLSALAYQYCIWQSQAWPYYEKVEFSEKRMSLKWLLEYDTFPYIRYIRFVDKILGVYTAKLLFFYKYFFSKSA